MPRIINRYIFLEISVPFFLSILILTLTGLLSKVIKLVELMVTRGIGVSFIFWFIMSVIPSFLMYTIPIAFLIAVLIAFTRMSSDSEITAIKASGVGLLNIMKPVFLLAVIAYFMTLSITLYLFPWGNGNLKTLLFDAARAKLVSGIEEKSFYDRFKGVVLYVDHISNKTGEMEGIFITEEYEGRESNIFFAKKGVFLPSSDKSMLYMNLYDGTIHRRSSNNKSYHIVDFSAYTLELNIAGAEPINQTNRPRRELYIGELLERARLARTKGEDPRQYILDLNKRFALPASIFVFSLLGIPLGIQKIRVAKFTGFSVALGIVLVYYVMSTALDAFGSNGVIPPAIAAWGTDIIFGAAGIYVFYMASKDTPVTPSSWFKGFGGKKD